MAGVYVFSTLTASQEYRKYSKGGADINVVERSVFIAGGSNIPDKYLRTPIGVMTHISDEDYAWLKEDESFKLHEKNGFIKVENKAFEAEVVAADMETRDQSAPTVDADLKDEGLKTPASVGGKEVDADAPKAKNSRKP